MKIKPLSFLFLLVTINAFSQEEGFKIIKGKVLSSSLTLEDIHVINKNTEIGTLTNADGNFTIKAKLGDVILFSAVHLKGKEIELTQELFLKDSLLVTLEPVIGELKEVVVVNYSRINAYDLGIVSVKPKSYTPAERRLKVATGYDEQIGLNMSFSLEPLINLISGRTAILKKELVVERKELYIVKIKEMFDDIYISKKLLIPLEYSNGFRFYLVEDARFVKQLMSNDKMMTAFMMHELASTYKNLFLNEK